MSPAALRGARSALAALAAAAFVLVANAGAQTIDVGRPRDFVVGVPPGARVDRIDTARTARSRTRLPVARLRTAWRATAGAPVDSAPLVDARGRVYVVNVRGDVVALTAGGTEAWHLATNALQPGPAALLADDTVVFTDGSGDAIAVRDGSVRWRTRFARAEFAPSSPLPLADGGIVVATAHDLAALDADGNVRARTTLDDAIGAPLLSAGGRVIAVAADGNVWAWTPGAAEASRLASFGATVDGSAALADDRTLVAVTAGQSTLAVVDLVRGGPSVLAAAPGGIWLGGPALRGHAAAVAMLGPIGEFVVRFDGAGREVGRTLLSARVPLARVDGGAPPAFSLVNSPGVGPSLLVDDADTLAFASLDGALGTTSAAGGAGAGESVETVADACPSVLGLGLSALGSLGGAGSPVVGLAPLGPGTFVAVCRSGALVAVTGNLAR